MVSLSTTSFTPSVALTIAMARSRPASDATVPVSVTTLSVVLTLMRLCFSASSPTNFALTFVVIHESETTSPVFFAAFLVSCAATPTPSAVFSPAFSTPRLRLARRDADALGGLVRGLLGARLRLRRDVRRALDGDLVFDARHAVDLGEPRRAALERRGRHFARQRRDTRRDRDVDVRVLQRRVRFPLLFDQIFELIVAGGRRRGAVVAAGVCAKPGVAIATAPQNVTAVTSVITVRVI